MSGTLIRALASATLLLTLGIAFGQSDTARPKFDVASIKLSLAGGGQYTIQPSPGGFRATNIPLTYLIMWASKINDYQLVGAPSWASDRYDIAAKPGAATDPDRRLMLQSLLEDRFKLKVHREGKERTEYALTIAKGGPNLKEPKDASCQTESASTATPCGRLSWSHTELAGRRASMQALVFVLS